MERSVVEQVEPLLLPLDPEKRLARLREIFEKQCKKSEGVARRLFCKNHPEYAFLADDAVFEAKLGIWFRWLKLNGEIPSFRTYLCRAVLNRGSTLIDKEKRHLHERLYRVYSNGIEESIEVPMEIVLRIRNEECQLIRNAISRLPKPFQETLHLQLKGRSYAEIAAKLVIAEGTVRSRLSRARELIGAYLVKRGFNAESFSEYDELTA